ncbi:hypothetical protein MXMO3_01753 [Maritalea myrionectae]|uniref:Uncharacterized protein n=1 Tax=Maritalea myrionectae TaxID=454601 RepID=A0A2R4ME13_9HYPH|nr:hypothetical protein [Maritalea myrionectae]AVX04278.1 hypothetical protein MXMO3_01753 [Maritalea myrionectae]
MTSTNERMATIHGMLKSNLELLESGLRGTGRSTDMMHHVEPGDIVVFPSSQTLEQFRRMLPPRLRGKCRLEVVQPDEMHLGNALKNVIRGGTVHFDHSWVQAYWVSSIDCQLGHFQSFNKFLEEVHGGRRDDEKPERTNEVPAWQ